VYSFPNRPAQSLVSIIIARVFKLTLNLGTAIEIWLRLFFSHASVLLRVDEGTKNQIPLPLRKFNRFHAATASDSRTFSANLL
jgi:hypothetical protein